MVPLHSWKTLLSLLWGTSQTVIIWDDITFTWTTSSTAWFFHCSLPRSTPELPPEPSHLGAAPTSVMLNSSVLRAGHNPIPFVFFVAFPATVL